ncbi:hypothetical protein J5N97_029687 [Dioscorea zingiberensis]|uniref:Uncharacterized protein n=1 Tax=Dioscorea zingiberensis TaxID=325984 RepID=A0A9D5BVU7_9LILI|nr:hypothetical protein J5N97_029687 [Dioscorea zingiberensis]
MRQDSCMAAKGWKLFGVRIVGDGGCGEAEEEEEVMRKSSSMGNLASAVPAAESGGPEQGYLSDGGIVQSSRGRGGHERKRGVPWTEEEHRTFLAGLEKLGKGDWRGISRNFVKTRTPTQVASHAQKYFLRQNNPNKKKRRSSLFDVVINDKVPAAEPASVSPLIKSDEVKEVTDPLPEENHLVGISTSSTTQVLDCPAALPFVMNSTDNPVSNLMVRTSSPTKNQSRPPTLSLIPALNIQDHSPTLSPHHSKSSICVPDFLKLSLSHPHCSLPSTSTSPSTGGTDLELSIAPPHPQGSSNVISVI